MKIPANQFPTIEQMTDQLKTSNNLKTQKKNHNGLSFSELLKGKQSAEKTKELTFSKHANERLANRNIDLTDDQYQRLETGAKKAGEKGINESLVMIDNLAFIVSVKNNTVITAVNDGEDRIFTNIDGAVIM